MSSVHTGLAVLGNTHHRVEGYLEAGSISKSKAQRLRGRLGFAEGQVFGRKGGLARKRLTQHVHALPFCRGTYLSKIIRVHRC